MEALANVEDLADRLGRTLDGTARRQASAFLTDASAAIRAYTGQIISRADTTVRLVPKRYTEGVGILLPQWPIVSIDEVVDDAAAAVTLNWVAGDFILTPAPLTVTYTHGYHPVPDDVVAIACQVAGRAFNVPDTGGANSVQLGNYSEQFGGAAASGALGFGTTFVSKIGLLDDETKTLNRYRRPSRPVSMLPARDVLRDPILTDFA